jgi:hypothetical protein
LVSGIISTTFNNGSISRKNEWLLIVLIGTYHNMVERIHRTAKADRYAEQWARGGREEKRV